jgi:chemotaxis response regulator CheB
MQQAGARTLAQDENTCTVYGMPREAVRLGAVGRIVPLGDIPEAIGETLRSAREAIGNQHLLETARQQNTLNHKGATQ